MITKAEYEKSRHFDIEPLLKRIEDTIRNKNFINISAISLGHIPRDQRNDVRVKIRRVMENAGWAVEYEMADSRDGCEDLYIKVS